MTNVDKGGRLLLLHRGELEDDRLLKMESNTNIRMDEES